MKLWKPAVCLLLSGLLLSACVAPAGSASSGAEGNPAGELWGRPGDSPHGVRPRPGRAGGDGGDYPRV